MRLVTITHGQDCFRFRVPTVAAWSDVAAYLKDHVKPGEVIALSGPLGAGKTTLVQALAKAFGIKRMPQSPTFALMRSYPIPGRTPVKRLLHVDAYRIDDERDLLALDLDEELLDGKTVLVVEWPEKIPVFISTRKTISVSIRAKK